MRNFRFTLVFAMFFATLTGWSIYNQLNNINNINSLRVPNVEDTILVGWWIVAILTLFTIYLIITAIIFLKNKE